MEFLTKLIVEVEKMADSWGLFVDSISDIVGQLEVIASCLDEYMAIKVREEE